MTVSMTCGMIPISIVPKNLWMLSTALVAWMTQTKPIPVNLRSLYNSKSDVFLTSS